MNAAVDASTVAKAFNSIMQELESAEDMAAYLRNSIGNVRKEIEITRTLISKTNGSIQSLADELSRQMDQSAQCNVTITELECEKKMLHQYIREMRQHIATKRAQLEKLKVNNNEIILFTENLESFTSERSLLLDPAMQLSQFRKETVSGGVEDVAAEEDLSAVDLADFAWSQ